jgi:hypothetical protein
MFTQNICYYNHVERTLNTKIVGASVVWSVFYFYSIIHIQLKFVIASDRSGSNKTAGSPSFTGLGRVAPVHTELVA